MTEVIKKSLRDSKTARWGALAIISFTMLCGYLFAQIISPLKPMLELPVAEGGLGIDSASFAMIASAYAWFNVFIGMLIISGMILDKIGIRFTAIMSAAVMVAGAIVMWYSFDHDFHAGSKIFGLHARIFYASVGYAIFGVGVEAAGITVSKIIVKWFKGKEMALAMGLEMAFARLGTTIALFSAPFIAERFNIAAPFGFGALLLVIGLLSFIIYVFMDIKLDKESSAKQTLAEDEFKPSDILFIIKNRGFWYIAILCVLFYSAVFPFYHYGPDLMVNKFGMIERWAGSIPALVPLGTILLTPIFGSLYDRKGKGASIMILGSVLLILVHLTLFLPFITSVIVAAIAIIVMGIAFSLVPSAMWPSVPKIIPEKQLGSAYALIFWLQNLGAFWGFPLLIGIILDRTNPGVFDAKQAGEDVVYNYTTTWSIFIGVAVLALVFAFLLKAEDKRKGYGLELPNIEK